MFKLIKIEAKKVISYKTFLIYISLYSALLTIIFFSISKFKFNSDGAEFGLTNFYLLPKVWHNLSYIAGWMTILLCSLIILLITNEFNFKTLRQNIIDGLTRFEIFMAKVIFNCLLSIYATLLIFILGIISILIFNENVTFELVTERIVFIPAFALQTFAFLTLALFIGITFKKQGTAIISFLLYYFIIERLVSLVLMDEDKPDNYIFNIIANHLPAESFDSLIKNPFTGMFGIPVPPQPETEYYIATIIYIIVFSSISLLLIKKTSL